MRLNGDVGEPRTLDAGVEFVEFNVLGPVTVTRGSTAMNVGGPKQRAVLAVLIARRSRPVTADVIVDAVYGDGASSRHRRTVQSYVSTLRSELGDVIEKSGSGWTLTADPSAVDAHRFEQAIRTADELDPASASEAASVDLEKPGRRDSGSARTSMTRRTPARCSAAMNSAIVVAS